MQCHKSLQWNGLFRRPPKNAAILLDWVGLGCRVPEEPVIGRARSAKKPRCVVTHSGFLRFLTQRPVNGSQGLFSPWGDSSQRRDVDEAFPVVAYDAQRSCRRRGVGRRYGSDQPGQGNTAGQRNTDRDRCDRRNAGRDCGGVLPTAELLYRQLLLPLGFVDDLSVLDLRLSQAELLLSPGIPESSVWQLLPGHRLRGSGWRPCVVQSRPLTFRPASQPGPTSARKEARDDPLGSPEETSYFTRPLAT